MEQQTLKIRIFGLSVIVVSWLAILYLLCYRGIARYQLLDRLFFSIMCMAFGIGLRMIFFVQWFGTSPNNEQEEKDFKIAIRSFIYNLVMSVMICSLIYLGFYDVFKRMDAKSFLILTPLLFIAMGGVIKTVIQKFGLK
jgi:hypothetical protein